MLFPAQYPGKMKMRCRNPARQVPHAHGTPMLKGGCRVFNARLGGIDCLSM
jgi:hypothetical protein